MIEENECREFLGRYVAVGVPHFSNNSRLFFYYGILIEVENGQVKLNTKNGYRTLYITDIREIIEKKKEATKT